MTVSSRLANELLVYDLLYKTPLSNSLSTAGSIHLALQLPPSLSNSFSVIKTYFLFNFLVGRFPKLLVGGSSKGVVVKRPLSFIATAPLLSSLFDRLLFEILPTVDRRELPFRSFLTDSGWVFVFKEFSELGFRADRYDFFGWRFPIHFRLTSPSPLFLSFFRIRFNNSV